MFCSNCGTQAPAGAGFCANCGNVLGAAAPQAAQHAAPAAGNAHYAPAKPIKSRTTAGILGILLGGLGVHKFYMGKIGAGIVYILLCWTYVPAIIGLVEGILYLVNDDADFNRKVNDGKFF